MKIEKRNKIMNQLKDVKTTNVKMNPAKFSQAEVETNKETKCSTIKFADYIWHIILIASSFILLFFSMKYLNNADDISPFFTFKYTISTILVWIAMYLILKGLTNRSFLSLAIVVSIEIIFDIINYIVLMVRGSAVTISDIKAIQTALSVSHNISISFEKKGILGLIFAFAVVLVLIIFRKKFIIHKNKWHMRCIKILSGASILFILFITNIYKTYSIWDINATYRTLGSPLTILRMARDINIHPPKGYNKVEITKLLSSYKSDLKTIESSTTPYDSGLSPNTSPNEDNPNIIVIINESFCDYYNLYKEGYADPIEYFTKLSKSENVISGTMYSSSFGGQTSNIEYEFLTQNSIRILPVGSYVFQQYITKPVTSSLVFNLKAQGYKTSAIHPWESFAYSRSKIYRLLGFDSIKFKNDIEGLEPNFNNDFFTDKSTYNELIKEIRQKKSNEKLFEYVLTVQNHTGFTNPDPNQITYHDENSINVYMQLIHESSEALKEVIDELKNSNEKYILLFFGDHQPNLDDEDNLIERGIEQYETPFIIWANYDIEEQYNIKTSTIFLQNYLLKAAGIEFSAMNNYMDNLNQYYQVITPIFCIDSNNNILSTDNTASDPNLIEYNKVDYYRIFDSK